jgi:small subunit ribosomal protein S1
MSCSVSLRRSRSRAAGLGREARPEKALLPAVALRAGLAALALRGARDRAAFALFFATLREVARRTAALRPAAFFVRFLLEARAFRFAITRGPFLDSLPINSLHSNAYRDISGRSLSPAGAEFRKRRLRSLQTWTGSFGQPRRSAGNLDRPEAGRSPKPEWLESIEEDTYGMVNVDDERTQKTASSEGAQPAPRAGTRSGQPRAGVLTPFKDEDVDPQEFSKLLDIYDNSFRNIAEGEVMKGIVLKVTPSEVIVDVGYKSEGMIALSEFLDENGEVTVQQGDIVDVLLERTEDREGYVVLSREKAEKMKIWDEVEKAYAERKVVIGRVIERIKGGLAVDIGVRAFLPGSQIDVRPVRNLDALRGQELRMRVIKVNKKRGNIVLSRKVLLEEENAEKKKHTLHTLAEGKVLKGTVKNITDYGAFIDLGGIDGLLHITDMSWGRVGHPSELFKVNDEIDVIVLKYDPATERVSLGHKQLVNDPWSNVSERYPVGARVSGKVVSLTDYGAFIELEPGVEGLIHVSEMSWSKRVKHPSKILNVGDPIDAQVLGVDATARRISLGLKQVETNPWHELADKYPVGSKIVGKVRNLTEFGAFVEVEDDIDGLIHISDMSWSKRIKHPSEVLKKGDKVEAMVLNIDAENQRLSLGLKQLATDIWDDFFSRHQVGQTIEGKVVRVTNFGAFVELDEGIEGLIHVSELDDTKGGEKIDLQVDQTYPMKIIKLVPSERKIGLSIRAMKSDEVRTDWEEYAGKAGSSETTLGDHFKAQN